MAAGGEIGGKRVDERLVGRRDSPSHRVLIEMLHRAGLEEAGLHQALAELGRTVKCADADELPLAIDWALRLVGFVIAEAPADVVSSRPKPIGSMVA